MFTKKTLRKMYPGERKLAEACNNMELEVKRMKKLLPVIHDLELMSKAMARMNQDQDHGVGCDGPLNCTCELTEGTNTWPDGGQAIEDHLARSQDGDGLTFPVQMTTEQFEAWQEYAAELGEPGEMEMIQDNSRL